jgi:hypothetical protein
MAMLKGVLGTLLGVPIGGLPKASRFFFSLQSFFAMAWMVEWAGVRVWVWVVSVCFTLFSFLFSFLLFKKYLSMYIPINFYLSTSLFYIFSSHHKPIKLILETNNYTHD